MQTEITQFAQAAPAQPSLGEGFNADASYDGLHLHYLLFRISKTNAEGAR